MELRKAYIDCERKRTEREIEKENKKLENGERTPEQHKKVVILLRNELESKILNLII